jgi:NAD(P)-dependent dehydrogenase (short-subunit alcohol dehydrogenase family)
MNQMEGKVVLITGATNGIGKAAALSIARQGATVIVVGRNSAKTEAVVAEISAESNSRSVKAAVADLSSQEQVRTLADEFKRKYDRLDVLINNAGALFDVHELSVDNIEMTFALNHFSYFILTMELLDLLKASAPSRIVNVSSGAHQFVRGINFDAIEGNNKRGYVGFRTYSESKLANLLFTYELARRLRGTNVTVNAMHPGAVSSGFAQTGHGIMTLAFRMLRPFMITPEKAADTVVYLATAPEVEGVTGKYFEKRKPIQSSALSYDSALQERFWHLTEALIRQPTRAQSV